ncbi:uncharacterized protein LOC141898944 [Tubulanus polymorphus]|uniref:uncharacterized protein LOC141898944 n=1 Tax=Tubulanus polymorphus TaxID=672921 RepID=UPI003DA4081B
MVRYLELIFYIPPCKFTKTKQTSALTKPDLPTPPSYLPRQRGPVATTSTPRQDSFITGTPTESTSIMTTPVSRRQSPTGPIGTETEPDKDFKLTVLMKLEKVLENQKILFERLNQRANAPSLLEDISNRDNRLSYQRSKGRARACYASKNSSQTDVDLAIGNFLKLAPQKPGGSSYLAEKTTARNENLVTVNESDSEADA